MTDNRRLDGDFWGAGRPARPSNGGAVTISGGPQRDAEGNRQPPGSLGNGQVTPVPGGTPGRGIEPRDKDPSPRNT
jgi:hypothetical protein